MIHVGTLEPRLFTPDDQELLELVASRAALAIEKARIHQETVRLDQLKLNFVAVASHELRTPATAVYGITATLRERGDELSEETRIELEETLWTQVNRLRLLIEQLLDLSRLDASAISIQSAADRFAFADRRGHRRNRPGSGRADRHRRGARGARGPAGARADHGQPGRQRSSLRRAARDCARHPMDTYLRVSVEDKGNGVPPELVPRLFERFERGTVGEGSGLGLSIAQRMRAPRAAT